MLIKIKEDLKRYKILRSQIAGMRKRGEMTPEDNVRTRKELVAINTYMSGALHYVGLVLADERVLTPLSAERLNKTFKVGIFRQEELLTELINASIERAERKVI